MPGFRQQQKNKYVQSTSWIWPYNHCGPGRSDGKWQSSVITTYGSTGPADEECAEHDTCYATATTQEEFDQCDETFYKKQWEKQGNIDGKIMGTLVSWGGKYARPSETELQERREQQSGQKRKRDTDSNPSEENLQGKEKVLRLRGGARNQGAGSGNTMAAAAGGGGGTMGETGLMPFSKAALIQPEYTTQSFKWIAHWDQKSEFFDKSHIRVNSPFDPNPENNANTSTGTQYNNRNYAVNGWNEYRGRYRYYRIVSNRVTVTFVPYELATITTSKNGIDTWSDNQMQREILNNLGRKKTPIVCGITLNPASQFPTNSTSITRWTQLAQAKYTDFAIGFPGEKKTFTINYSPDTWNAVIAEQQRETFWTPMDQSPLIADTVCVWYSRLDGDATNSNGITDANSNYDENYIFPPKIGIVVTMDMTVQFREWTDNIKARSYQFDYKATTDEPSNVTIGGGTYSFTDVPPTG